MTGDAAPGSHRGFFMLMGFLLFVWLSVGLLWLYDQWECRGQSATVPFQQGMTLCPGQHAIIELGIK
jgi:hypothetical protein